MDDPMMSKDEAVGFFAPRLGPDPNLPQQHLQDGESGSHAPRGPSPVSSLIPRRPDDRPRFRLLQIVAPSPGDKPKAYEVYSKSYVFDIGQEDTPRYAALSYVWGEMRHKATIILDGNERKITDSLFGALKQLQVQFLASNTSMYLWVDALCIDQENGLEVNNQVDLMPRIYGDADVVLIWLGEEDDATPSRWKQLAAFYAQMQDVEPSFRTTGLQSVATLASQLHLTTHSDLIETSRQMPVEFEVFQYIFSHPYWSRMWTFQETIVARRAILMCGSYAIGWHNFIDMCAKLGTVDTDHAYQAPTTSLLMMRGYQSQFNSSERTSLTLSVLLTQTRHRCATDPRDKVFSLFGLTMKSGYRYQLRANYSRSVEQVYAAAAVVCLVVDENLVVLGCTKPKESAGLFTLPSWLPDWRYPKADTWHMCNPTFDAAGGSKTSVKIVLDGDCLLVRGFVVETVGKLTNHSDEESHKNNPLEHYHVLASNASVFHDKKTPLVESDGFSDTCARNAHPSHHTSSDMPKSIRHDQQFSPMPTRGQRDNCSESSTCRAIDDRDLAKQMAQAMTTLDENSWKAAVRSLYGPGSLAASSYVFTSHGLQHVGFCSEDARPGDKICIFYGSSVPYMLRPCDSSDEPSYTLVGDCYVHGIMFGELLEPSVRPKFEETTFVIR